MTVFVAGEGRGWCTRLRIARFGVGLGKGGTEEDGAGGSRLLLCRRLFA